VSIVAVVGHGATTTAVALATTWPTGSPAVCLEADPAGGVLAAWLDVPQGGGLSQAAALPSPTWPQIESLLQRSPTGLQVLTAPIRAVEAAAAVHELSHRVVPILSALRSPVFVADCGRPAPGSTLPEIAAQASLVVVPVLQHGRSIRAAAVHIERIAELCDALASRAVPTVLAVIGSRPYSSTEIARFVSGDEEPIGVVELAVDEWSAQLLAGRTGSSRRVARGALLRSARAAAAELATRLRSTQQPVAESENER
jgi:hypothetical protein